MMSNDTEGTCGDGNEKPEFDIPARVLRAGQTITLYHMDELGSRLVEVSGNCVVTKKPHTIVVEEDGLNKWLTGDHLIQDVLNIGADDREFLMTGISPEGWNVMFPVETV